MINKQKGQSLIETLVALAMAVIIMSAIALTMITAINSGDFAKKQNLATQYAQQGLEQIKQDAQDGSAKLDSAKYTGSGFTDVGDASNKFVRSATIGSASGKCGTSAYVTVKVAWTDGKCAPSSPNCHDVTLDSCVVDNVDH